MRIWPGLAVFLIGLVVAHRVADMAACWEIGTVTGRATAWRPFSGCYVEVDGRLVPRDAWQGEFEVGPGRTGK